MDTRAPERRSRAETTEVVVIGGGHAGLAVSRLLTAEGRDHVVLERGRVAERWRSERWDSLHLLTPNWLTRLPGWHYEGEDQDGFMSAAAFTRYLERYSESFGAPVVSGATVRHMCRQGDHFLVASDAGSWVARDVVIATGPHGRPRLPAGVDPALVLPSTHGWTGEPIEGGPWTNGFDLIFRGLELVTGGQRLHRHSDYVAAIEARGESPSSYAAYLQTFAHGMPPHGGFAIGLERWVARLVEATNIREVTLFPRDLHRLAP